MNRGAGIRSCLSLALDGPEVVHVVGNGPGAGRAPIPAMIVRVLRAHVEAGNVGAFNALLRAQLLELRGQPGLVYAKLARRLDEHDGEEVVLFEEWETPSDVWAWAGGRLDRARLLPGTEELVRDLEIAHYEALDRHPWGDEPLLDPRTGLPRAQSEETRARAVEER